MEIIIISGRSGAGKSVALRALEDMAIIAWIISLSIYSLNSPIFSPKLKQLLQSVLIIRNLPHSSADLDKIRDRYSSHLFCQNHLSWTAIVVHLFVVTAIHVVSSTFSTRSPT